MRLTFIHHTESKKIAQSFGAIVFIYIYFVVGAKDSSQNKLDEPGLERRTPCEPFIAPCRPLGDKFCCCLHQQNCLFDGDRFVHTSNHKFPNRDAENFTSVSEFDFYRSFLLPSRPYLKVVWRPKLGFCFEKNRWYMIYLHIELSSDM